MEFEIKGVNYRTAKLDVFQQLTVSRKLLPVLSGLMTDFGPLKSVMARNGEGKIISGEQKIFDALDIVLPKIADTLSPLPEEDVNAIIYPCLGVVSRQHEKGWVKVFDGGVLMFDDIDLFTMLQLVARVVADSLGNFLKELLASVMSIPPAA